MADRTDIEEDLLDAIYTSLETDLAAAAVDKDLSWMKFFCAAETINWQDFYGLLPAVVFWALDPIIIPTCIAGPLRVEDCTYRIKIAAIQESTDPSYGTHSASVKDLRVMSSRREDLDLKFGYNMFSLSDDCYMESPHYGIPTIPGYQVDSMTWLWASEITCVHRYIRQLTIS